MSGPAGALMIHSPARKRYFVAGSFSQDEALRLFADCVRFRFWPLVGPDGVVWEDITEDEAKQLELLRGWSLDARGAPVDGGTLERLAHGADLFVYLLDS